MEAVIHSIIRHSVLQVSELDFSQPTDESFRLSLKARITRFGPIHATVSSMRVRLQGRAGPFAYLDLDETIISPTGGDIVVHDQLVQITDLTAFETFVRAVVLEHAVVLDIVEGHGIVTALGMITPMTFTKSVVIRGMEHIRIDIVKLDKVADPVSLRDATVTGVPIEATIRLQNPSPIQIEIGKVRWELTNDHQPLPASHRLIHSARSGAQPQTTDLVDLISSAIALQTKIQLEAGSDVDPNQKLFAEFCGAEPLTILRDETVFAVRGTVRPSIGEDTIRQLATQMGFPIEMITDPSFSIPNPELNQFYPCRLRGLMVETAMATAAIMDGAGDSVVPDWMNRIVQSIDLPVGVPIDPELACMFIRN